MLDEISSRMVVSDIPTMLKEMRTLYEEYSKDRPERMPCEWIDFFPTEQKTSFLTKKCFSFSPSSFKEAIGTSQAYSLRINDVRRRGNPLFLNKDSIMKACDFRSTMLRGGSNIPGHRSCLPTVVSAVDVGVEPEEGA